MAISMVVGGDDSEVNGESVTGDMAMAQQVMTTTTTMYRM